MMKTWWVISFLVSSLFVRSVVATPSVEQNEVRFTGESNIADWLVQSIDDAEERIKIMVFIFEYEPISDALIRASNRGVEVEVVTDVRSSMIESVPRGMSSIPDKLISGGVDCYIYDDRPSIMHHKAIFIDGTLFVGSYNFQDAATFKNCENLLRTHDIKVYESFMSEYERVKRLCHLHIVNSEHTESEVARVPLFSRIAFMWHQFRWILALTLSMSLALNLLLLLIVVRRR